MYCPFSSMIRVCGVFRGRLISRSTTSTTWDSISLILTCGSVHPLTSNGHPKIGYGFITNCYLARTRPSWLLWKAAHARALPQETHTLVALTASAWRTSLLQLCPHGLPACVHSEQDTSQLQRLNEVRSSHSKIACNLPHNPHVAVGQNPVPPVNIPIPTKIGSKMGSAPAPNRIPLVLPHSHVNFAEIAWRRGLKTFPKELLVQGLADEHDLRNLR